MMLIKRLIGKSREVGAGYVLKKGYMSVIGVGASPIIDHITRVEYGMQKSDPRGPNERQLEYAFALNALRFSNLPGCP